MGPQSRVSISWAVGTFRYYGYAAFRRYRQLGIRGKVFAVNTSGIIELTRLLVHSDILTLFLGHLHSHTDRLHRARSGSHRPGAV